MHPELPICTDRWWVNLLQCRMKTKRDEIATYLFGPEEFIPLSLLRKRYVILPFVKS